MPSLRELLSDLRAKLAGAKLSLELRRGTQGIASQQRVFNDMLLKLGGREGPYPARGQTLDYPRFRALFPLQTAPQKSKAEGAALVRLECFPSGAATTLSLDSAALRRLRRKWKVSLHLFCNQGAPLGILRSPSLWHGTRKQEDPRQTGLFPQAEPLTEILRELIGSRHAPALGRGLDGLPGEANLRGGLQVVPYPGLLRALLLEAWEHENLASNGLSFLSLQAPYGIQEPYFKKPALRKIRLFEMFCCPSGILAAQDRGPGQGLRLFTDDFFYEFLPFAELDESRIGELGSKALSLTEVQVNVDYLLILSSPGSLCRFVTGEVIRFLGLSPHRVQRQGTAGHALRALGENLTERMLADALAEACEAHGWIPVHFHVAPQLSHSLTGQLHGRHEWWIELLPGSQETPTGPVLCLVLDKILCDKSPTYAQRRKAGTLAAPLVRLLIPGIFDRWADLQTSDAEYIDLPVSLPNRNVADVLAKLTRFYD